MATKLVNGVRQWVPDTDGGLASYGANRYNMDGLNSYGGMDTTASVVINSTTPSPVANANAQGYLDTFNFDGVKKVGTTSGSNNWTSNAEQFSDLKNTTKEEGFGDTFSRWFTPQGDKGTSLGGNVMSAVGTGVGALTGLAGAYYTAKNYELQKDNQKYLQNREAQSDARKTAFATNAGNGASY